MAENPQDALSFALTIRPWREHDYSNVSQASRPPYLNWEERFCWPDYAHPGCTFSYYVVSQGTYGREEWVVLWNETHGTGVPVKFWRVL